MNTNFSAGLFTWWLLAGTGLSACGPKGSTLTVHVAGWAESGDGDLTIVPRIAGQLGQTQTFKAGTSAFVVDIEKGQAGDAVMDGFVAEAEGCFIATGSALAKFHGGDEAEQLSADLKLVHFKTAQCASANCGLSQWCQEKVTDRNLFGVWADSENAWAVGYAGTILHWTAADGWQPVDSPTNYTLTAIWGSGSSDIWAVGTPSIVIHFDGTIWSASTYPSPSITFHAVAGRGSSDAIWAGGDALTVASRTSPVAWGDITLPMNAYPIRSIQLIGEKAWIVGRSNFIGLVNNGVVSSVQVPASGYGLFGIWGFDDNHVWAVGENGVVYTNSNTKHAWEFANPIGDKPLTAITGDAARDQLWAVGLNGIILDKKIINSVQPTLLTEITRNHLNSVFAAPNGRVWAVGDNGTILRYN